MISNRKATWRLELDCKCPNCNEIIDLLDDSDFFLDGIEACEHGTPRTTNYEVVCGECDHEFKVDFVY